MLYLILSFHSPMKNLAKDITLFLQPRSFKIITVPLSRNNDTLRSPIIWNPVPLGRYQDTLGSPLGNLVPLGRNPEHPTQQVLDHFRSPLGNCQEPSLRKNSINPVPLGRNSVQLSRNPEPLKNPDLDQNTAPFHCTRSVA